MISLLEGEVHTEVIVFPWEIQLAVREVTGKGLDLNGNEKAKPFFTYDWLILHLSWNNQIKG